MRTSFVYAVETNIHGLYLMIYVTLKVVSSKNILPIIMITLSILYFLLYHRRCVWLCLYIFNVWIKLSAFAVRNYLKQICSALCRQLSSSTWWAVALSSKASCCPPWVISYTLYLMLTWIKGIFVFGVKRVCAIFRHFAVLPQVQIGAINWCVTKIFCMKS